MVIDTALGALRQTPPVTWVVDADGRRRPVEARCEIRGPDRFGFTADAWDGVETLVIDPGLLWGTYFGGSAWDFGQVLDVDAQGIVTVAGFTLSGDYPLTPGAFATSGGAFDVVVSRFDPSTPRGSAGPTTTGSTASTSTRPG